MQTRVLPASVPHERMMLNLALFHILIPIVALASGVLLPLLGLALLGSLFSIGWIGWYARHHHFANDRQQQHWQLAWRHCRWLLYAYAVSALIMLMGIAMSLLQTDSNMGTIMLVIFSRLAVVPTLLMVLLLFVLETSALAESRKGN
ncbi:hypothetical protein [Methylophaga sp. OBS1]|uniref:hypothetical protein n=1 Tax=Methylophaga sp. OBS1 TaxID=2991933 RepID=UPI00224DD0E9|nr:hypothetical protein [Methylophaga sp. OBS1]MCX4193275.1 hypothetical protein [Methylophaga sp. OBS1]